MKWQFWIKSLILLIKELKYLTVKIVDQGFEFARQREPLTDGIDIWGEVFEFDHEIHGKVALIVLDTQESGFY